MKARLLSSREIAPLVRHFEFDVPALEHFDFKPGQFVSLSAPVGQRVITRAYSLASSPSGNRFELCLNLVEDGNFSSYLFALEPGAEVEMAGPLGYFHWRQSSGDAILVATGTGIAPYRGMLQQRFAATPPSSGTVHLIFGVRHEVGLVYREEFAALEKQHPEQFRFWPVLSRPGQHWTGRSGHVQEHVMEALGERRDLEVYICGLKAMVDDLRARLKTAGLERKRIVYEKYD